MEHEAHHKKEPEHVMSKKEKSHLGHVRIYGAGPHVAVHHMSNDDVLDAEHYFDNADDAKNHLAEVVDEHFDANREQQDGDTEES